jgi:Fe-S cluster assembly protein SufD
MAIESFLKVDKADPDWIYSPSQYHGKQFKMIDANCLQIREGTDDVMVLRLSPTENELLCKHLQIVGRESSKLDLYIICDGSEQTQQVFLYNVTAEPNSVINIGVFIKGGKLNKHIFECEAYENSEVNIYGLAENDVGGSSEVIAKVYHAGKNALSQQWIHCASSNKGRTVFQGLVNIEKGTTESFTRVTNSSIIKDDTGQAFSIPQLMIECGDVEASHSCTVGKLDQESLWYLQSRGMSVQEAKKLMLEVHQDRIINIIPHSDIQDEIKGFFRD